MRELRDQGRTDYIVGACTSDTFTRALRPMLMHAHGTACTGNALLEDQASFREAGADHILTKPVKIKVGRSRLLRAVFRR